MERAGLLNARRAVESDKRSLQKLLRTLGSHWKMRIQKEAGKSWLQLITPETFAQALDQDRNREGEVGDPEPDAMLALGHADSKADDSPELRICSSAAPCRFALQLNKDFDARSYEMHAALQACR